MAGQQPQGIITIDGKPYYDLGPGLKPRPAPEPSAPSFGTAFPGIPGSKAADAGGFDPKTLPENLHAASSFPLVTAGVAGAASGGALAIPGIVAALTSMLHDTTSPNGEDHDPRSVAGSALLNGSAAMIPGIGGKLYEGAPAMSAAVKAASSIPGKLGAIFKMGGAMLPEAESAAPAAAKAAPDLVGQYASPSAQSKLVKAMVDIENRMNAATGPAKIALKNHLDMLTNLNTQAVAAMKRNAVPTIDAALQAAGLPPVTTAASVIAKQAAAKAAQHRDAIVNGLRTVLGLGQAAKGAGQ